MDDVWTDWQTDGWIGAHRHRWSHSFVTTPTLGEGGEEGVDQRQLRLAMAGGGNVDTSVSTPPLHRIGREVRTLTPRSPPIGCKISRGSLTPEQYSGGAGEALPVKSHA